MVEGGGKLAAAVLAMTPQCLRMAATGYVPAGRLSTALQSGLLSFPPAFWFTVSFFGPELHSPPAAPRLSAFHFDGTPFVHGPAVGDTLVVLALAALAQTGAALRFLREDIGRFVR